MEEIKHMLGLCGENHTNLFTFILGENHLLNYIQFIIRSKFKIL